MRKVYVLAIKNRCHLQSNITPPSEPNDAYPYVENLVDGVIVENRPVPPPVDHSNPHCGGARPTNVEFLANYDNGFFEMWW